MISSKADHNHDDYFFKRVSTVDREWESREPATFRRPPWFTILATVAVIAAMIFWR